MYLLVWRGKHEMKTEMKKRTVIECCGSREDIIKKCVYARMSIKSLV